MGAEFTDTRSYLEKIECLIDKVEDWSVLPDKPVVSVWMITYNHEAFIRQAIDGILMQRTSFAYEIVIGEDKSTDRTREIVREYQRLHPDKLRLRLAKENLYSQKLKPGIGVLRACRGTYIAMCEGDDYWTDPHKLQKQVEFLEAHPDYAVSSHDADVFWPDGTTMRYVRHYGVGTVKNTYLLEDILHRRYLPTASLVFRSRYLWPLPTQFTTCPGGDRLLLTILARNGLVAYVDEPWSVYRVHHGGATSLVPRHTAHVSMLRTTHQVGEYLGPSYAPQVRPIVLEHLAELVKESVLAATPSHPAVSINRVMRDVVKEYASELELSADESVVVLRDSHLALAFHFAEIEEWACARHCWFNTVRYRHPAVLTNRGFWSVGMSAFLGKRTGPWLRRRARSMVSRGNHVVRAKS